MKTHLESEKNLSVKMLNVFPELHALNATDLISRLSKHLYDNGFVTPEFKHSVLQREAEMPTGLPLDRNIAVALPHADTEHVLNPSITVATLIEPVDFLSMDDPRQNLPVSIVFLLALNNKEQQQNMLVSIAQMLQNKNALDRIQSAKTQAELLAVLNSSLELGE